MRQISELVLCNRNMNRYSQFALLERKIPSVINHILTAGFHEILLLCRKQNKTKEPFIWGNFAQLFFKNPDLNLEMIKL